MNNSKSTMSETRVEKSKDIDKEFANSTTCHGIYHWYASETTSVRVCWFFIVLAMLGVMISQVTLRIIAYYNYDTSTDISEEFVSYLDFPSVTICSFNRYFLRPSPDKLDAIYTLNQLTSSTGVARSEHSGVKPNMENLKVLGENFNITDFADEHGFSLGHQHIPDCTFKSQTCKAHEFRKVLTSLGKCYTFNEENYSRTQNIPGAGHGFSITLDAMQDLYTEEPVSGSGEAGLKIQIHPQYEVPDVETYGISVPAGHKASIEMTRTDYNMMHEPWGPCDSDREYLKYFTSYSLNNCVEECYTDAVIEKCGCRLFTQYWAADYARECSLSEMADCASGYLIRLKQKYSADDCGCTIPCTFTQYALTVSYSSFPNAPTSKFLQKRLNITEEEVENDFLKVEVYFETMSYKIFSQSKKVDESSLLSDVGGQLGLWLGMSFITLLEFFQYTAKKIALCFGTQSRASNVEVNHR